MPSFRYAFRALARHPAFAAVAILALALGLGANAAIFSVFHAVLLRPLPYPDADRIVMPWEFSREVEQRLGFDRLPSSGADFIDYLTRNRSFELFASMRTEQVNLTGQGEPERIGAVRVSRQFFDVLGVRPVVGRSFVAEDETRERLVMIAYSLWQGRFGGDPAVSGRVISLNGEAATIVGVLPPWFGFPAAGELPEGFGFTLSPVVWTLDVLTPEQQRLRGGKSFAMIGRLKPGVTLQNAEADLAGIAAEIARAFPLTNTGWTIRVIPLREQLVGPVRPALMALLTAVGFVLLIACANVANLLLVRATARQREFCVRSALGASRGALIAHFLAESLLLSVCAAAAGLAIAWWMLQALLAIAPASLPALSTQASFDWHVFAFTGVLALLIGVGFGAMPACHCTRVDLIEGLREGGRGTLGGRNASRLRNVLVVVEVALAVMLLIGSVLLIETFVTLTRVRTGFQTERLLTMEVALPKGLYTAERAAAFFQSLLDRLSVLPGVEAAGLASTVPLGGSETLLLVTVEGQPRPQPGQDLISDYRIVTAGYFEALGIPLIEGELPRPPAPGAPPRVWVNETMARAGWPGQQVVGRRMKLTGFDQASPWYTVAGIVGDTRQTGLEKALRPQIYVHHGQDSKQQMSIVLRASGDPMQLVAPAKAAVRAIDPDQPVARIRTMEEILTASLASRRFHMSVVGIFAALAVTLAVVGLYAVVSFSVAQRTHEMGLRLALGAQPSNLLTLVLSEGLKLVGAGVAIGVAGALILTQFLQALLFGVGARDLTTFVLAPALLLAAGTFGCLAPALRAMRVDPATALRSE